MKSIYYWLATMTAFMCINVMYTSYPSEVEKNLDTLKVQEIDMTDYTIYINSDM